MNYPIRMQYILKFQCKNRKMAKNVENSASYIHFWTSCDTDILSVQNVYYVIFNEFVVAALLLRRRQNKKFHSRNSLFFWPPPISTIVTNFLRFLSPRHFQKRGRWYLYFASYFHLARVPQLPNGPVSNDALSTTQSCKYKWCKPFIFYCTVDILVISTSTSLRQSRSFQRHETYVLVKYEQNYLFDGVGDGDDDND